jgi:hypothetical protein
MAKSYPRESSDDNITSSIVQAVADSKGVDPTELDIVLHDYVDSDALEQLAAHDAGSWTLSIELPEHTVTVTSDSVILVDGTERGVLAFQ